MIYKISYEFASKKTGALLRGNRIEEANSPQEAEAKALNTLRGQVKYPRIASCVEYNVGQLELPIPKGK